MKQYIELLRNILENGEQRDDRTKIGTLSLFSPMQLKFDISNSIPLLTIRNLGYKWIIKELLWFISGSTDNSILQAQNVHIWNGNSSAKFMEDNSLPLKENDIGALYGFTIRHWGADYIDCKTDYSGQGFDQLDYVENLIKNDPTSRRIIINNWNPSYFGKQVLTPCHMMIQFYVSEGKYLEGTLTIRSSDVVLGLPSNIVMYSLLIYILAMRCNLQPKTLNIVFGDAHIYLNHIEGVKELVKRTPFDSPQLLVNDLVSTKKWGDILVSDFIIINYSSHPKLKFTMAI